ncbi:hypothetical protein MRB53_006480 [Persea americana]|uniref:Uncharacterized protein n=1 Tax=Persea americana TaxID=3435 RepID=A0ACC2MHV8_PERAE|nr:hypothetical protein MRB53_006480 [Persea americana]|eukprot:TRINITY_DN1641_c0_g1_i1.p1 TRINITY_DN1641_c0_g1~~TRINITY_DN1641_c0_g1_i1.p1  ORF type:complete len:165 (+),score=39.27 TRINITY_DN1641_c0_g1_i1:197-691(+)
MEAQEGKSLLESVRPPRLEDAGLEDCALPPEAIKEAFLKAASSVRSAFNGRDCIEDPGPSDGDLHDSLVSDEAPMPCGCAGAVKESSPERCGGKEVIGIGEEASDIVVGMEVPKEGRGRACVDGLPEEIEGKDEEEERGGFERNEEEREEEEEEDRPILAEACI